MSAFRTEAFSFHTIAGKFQPAVVKRINTEPTQKRLAVEKRKNDVGGLETSRRALVSCRSTADFLLLLALFFCGFEITVGQQAGRRFRVLRRFVYVW